jgi:predicted KAP-like P-loop ATPase
VTGWGSWIRSLFGVRGSQKPEAADEALVRASEDKASADSALSADQPIERPEQDSFGLDPFARSISASIARMGGSDGVVIGIHGPWGSGKSSAVNLIKYHLRHDVPEARDLVIMDFSPWWFNGADTLALAFFRELGSTIGKSLPDRAKDAFRSLGRRLSGAGSVVGAAVDVATGGIGGAAVGGATSYLGDLLGAERTVTEEHAVLAKALRDQSARFLVVVDDIDRLGPDDALLVFKLVKSVGRLPNVTYLLVFDRQLAERAVNDRFPSEGPHYIEKILQASFELPPPLHEDLLRAVLDGVLKLMGEPADEAAIAFMNVFHDVVARFIQTPRDLARLLNTLQVTWPAVATEVDRGDFLGIEALRLFRPAVHKALHGNRDLVSGNRDRRMNQQTAPADCDARLLREVPDEEREQIRSALMRLFPALEGPWRNRYYQGDHRWRRDRRICSPEHFDTYFRFSVGDNTVPREEIDALIAAASDPAVVIEKFRAALARKRRNGGTRAALLLEELTVHAADVPVTNIQPLVTAIFRIGEEFDIAEDRAGAFMTGDNPLRLHWLLNRLVLERLDEGERDALFLAASEQASLGWLVDFVARCVGQYQPRADGSERGGPFVVSRAMADRLCNLALVRLREAAESGVLLARKDLVNLMFRWRDFAEDIAPPRSWLAGQLDRDQAVLAIAGSAISEGWTHQGDDRVSRRHRRVNRQMLGELVDVEMFLTRVSELLDRPTLPVEWRECLVAFNQSLEAGSRDRM